MKKERSTPEAKIRMKEAQKKYRASLSEEEIEERRKKQSEINNRPENRKKLSAALKKKWQDPEFREKMKNRKTRGKSK